MRILYFHCEKEKSLVPFGEACLSLTPKIFSGGASELYLDIGATQKYFGGEKPILSRIEKLRASFAIPMGMVLTDRPEWAKVFAHGPRESPASADSFGNILLPQGRSREYLLSLPIENILHCGDPAVLEKEFKDRYALIAFMKRVGLRHISDFARLNATAVGRRFGKLGMRLREFISGKFELCLPTFATSESIKEWIDTEDVPSLESLLFYLRQTFIRIEARLRGRGCIARELKLTFTPDSGKPTTRELKLAEPLREAQSFLKLLKDYLSDLNLESSLNSLEIEVSDMAPFSAGQLSLFDTTENCFADLAHYVARLRNRYGGGQVGFADLQESYFPERSWKMIPQAQKVKTGEARPISFRPPLLFTPPKPQAPDPNWRLTPSENLAAEWWEEGGFRRYFVAQTPRGERLWMFWDCQKQEWFVHGTFD